MPFNAERENFNNLNKATLEATQSIKSYQTRSVSLASPAKKREELTAMKEAL